MCLLTSEPCSQSFQACVSRVTAVFVSPETAQSTDWKLMFTDHELKGKISLIAVDEAHCISEWLIIINCSNLQITVLYTLIVGVLILGRRFRKWGDYEH